MKKFVLAYFLVYGIAYTSDAQPGSNPGGGGKPGGVPISGIEYLLIGGGLIGARKIIRSYKEKKQGN